MNLEITDKNLYLLLPGKVSRVVQMYACDRNIPLHEALCLFYRSDIYKSLEDESTKLWHYGPVALYEEFSDEMEKRKNVESKT